MRFASSALAALFSAAAFCSPAAAYEIDPITRQPVFYLPTAHRPQASATRRQLVSFTGGYAPGTVVVSTSRRRLYYVLGGGQAISYGVGVGRPGFTWAGTKTISMNLAVDSDTAKPLLAGSTNSNAVAQRGSVPEHQIKSPLTRADHNRACFECGIDGNCLASHRRRARFDDADEGCRNDELCLPRGARMFAHVRSRCRVSGGRRPGCRPERGDRGQQHQHWSCGCSLMRLPDQLFPAHLSRGCGTSSRRDTWRGRQAGC